MKDRAMNQTVFKKLCLVLVFGLLNLMFSGTNLNGQSSIATYYVVQYMKVSPSLESDYLELELEVWKKMHSARIKQGNLTAWYFYRVVAPSGTNTEYNYITVNEYIGAENLAGHFDGLGVNPNDVLTADEISMALQTPEVRDLVYEEVWTKVDDLVNEEADHMYRFQVFNSMKMKEGVDESDYQRIEQNYWKPVHNERISRGLMHGWGLYTMIIPGGTERDYHWATVDYYDYFIDYMRSTDDIMERIHGINKSQQYIQETEAKRDLLKAEIRELVDYVNKGTVN